MSKKDQKTAFELFVADLNASQDRVAKDEHGAADMAAHLIAAVMEAERGDNYPKLTGTVSRKEGKKVSQIEVTVDVDRLTALAQGRLTQADVSDTFDALAGLSPKVAEARKAYAQLMSMKAADRALYSGEIAAAKSKAHTMTQTLRRPVRMAAALIASPKFDATTARAVLSKGSRVVQCQLVSPVEGVPGKVRSVSTIEADKLLTAIAAEAGNAPKKRAPQASKEGQKTDAAPVAAPVATVTPETFRRGRKKALAQTLESIAHGVADMADGFNAAERADAIALVLTLIGKLDAEGKAEIAKALTA